MNSDICTRQNRPHCRFALKLNHGLDKQVSSIRACSVQSRHGKLYSRTRTNTNPNDTEANATGRRGVRACSANGMCENHGRGWPSSSRRARHLLVVRTLEKHRGRRKTLSSTSYLSSSQVKLILSPKQRAKPAASRTRTCTNAAVCIASGECPSRF